MTILRQPLAPWQRAFLRRYAGGEYEHIADAKNPDEAARNAGDGFVRAALIELDAAEDCDSFKVAQSRLETIVSDFQDIVDHFEADEERGR